MYHQPIATGIWRHDPLRALLVRSGVFMLLACAVAAATLWLRGVDALPATYFFDQDMPLLAIGGATLVSFGLRVWPGAQVAPLQRRHVLTASIVAAGFCYAGAHWILGHYGLSRDEALAEFATTHLRQGQLGQPIPPGLRDLAKAITPLWTDIRGPGRYWTSGYLPVNSVIRAIADLCGDRWLAGPALLAIGCISLWSAARRIWPHEPRAATVALILALSSTQLLTNAMTSYAMTAHFALNALWLACFLRGGRIGHAGALLIGLAAAGLHQWHFHLIFVSGFVAWLWLSRRRGLAGLYAAACCGYVAVWGIAYPHLLDLLLGARQSATGALPVVDTVIGRLSRMAELEPLTGLARFAAWQNALLLPLAVVGAASLRAARKPPTIVLAMAISCAAGLATIVFQGYGYGYRYLHGLIPCFCLLAAAGWLELERGGARMPARLLGASAGVALLLTAPFALWRSHVLLAPYAGAYRAARAAPADVVLVDTRGGRFLQDIVRLDGTITRPLLLDLGYVRATALARLCRTSRVMLFDERQARALGIKPPLYAMEADADAAARRAQLVRLRCARPVPLT